MYKDGVGKKHREGKRQTGIRRLENGKYVGDRPNCLAASENTTEGCP